MTKKTTFRNRTHLPVDYFYFWLERYWLPSLQILKIHRKMRPVLVNCLSIKSLIKPLNTRRILFEKPSQHIIPQLTSKYIKQIQKKRKLIMENVIQQKCSRTAILTFTWSLQPIVCSQKTANALCIEDGRKYFLFVKFSSSSVVFSLSRLWFD